MKLFWKQLKNILLYNNIAVRWYWQLHFKRSFIAQHNKSPCFLFVCSYRKPWSLVCAIFWKPFNRSVNSLEEVTPVVPRFCRESDATIISARSRSGSCQRFAPVALKMLDKLQLSESRWNSRPAINTSTVFARVASVFLCVTTRAHYRSELSSFIRGPEGTLVGWSWSSISRKFRRRRRACSEIKAIETKKSPCEYL